MEKKDKLKTVLTQIRKAQDAGFSQEDINNYILDSGYNSLKAFDKAVVNRASIGVRKRHPESEAGAILGYVREVASGLTLGLSNMGEALIYSIVNSTPYEFEKELLQTEREEYQDASPVLATTGGLAGAMVTGLGATKLAYKTAPSLLPKVGAPISNIAKEATLEAGLGAIEGGVTAATSGGDTTTAAGLGAGIGFISPLASRAISPIIDFTNKGIRRVRGEAPGIGGAEERALKKLDESFVNDGMTKADRLEKLMEFEDAGMGDQVRTGYLGKSNVHQLSKDAINAPGPAKTQVKEGLLADKEANSELTTKFMKENPGMVRTFIEVTHEANARYKAGKSDLNVIAKDAEMKLGDMKETIGGFKFLDAQETKTSMESGNLHKFLQGMGTPRGNVDTSFLPL